MGITPKRASVPDLFSASSVRVRNVLPGNLSTAIRQLDDQELARLFAAVVAERKRRNKKSSTSDDRRQARETRTHALTRGQINAVCAAFKAGITPSRIARQFGLSPSDVRKALAEAR